MTIGDRIRIRREELDMSQTELAKKVGYSGRSAVSKVECGERELKQSMIVKLASALGTTPSYIMGWDDEEVEPSAWERSLVRAYRNADPVTKSNVCLLLGIKGEEERSSRSAG